MAPGPAFLEERARVALDDYVRDLAWSPDGSALAIAGGEGGVFIVQRSAEALHSRVLGSHGLGTLAIAWAPRAGVFATSGQDGAVALWDAGTGTQLRRWQPSKKWTEQLAWSGDGRMLASAAGRTVSLWGADGTALQELPEHASTVLALAWDRPGRELGAASNGGVRVHRIETGKDGALRVTSRDYAREGTCLTVAFSPNGKVLASGLQDGEVHFWYLSSGRNSRMSGYGAKVALTAWSANSRYLATSAGTEIVVWDFAGKGPEGSRPAQLSGHTDRVESLAWQPGGSHLASGGRDWRLSLWLPGKTTQAVDAHLASEEITVVRWSADGRLLAVGGAKGSLALYELVQPA
jgi:WD40 repeat protein